MNQEPRTKIVKEFLQFTNESAEETDCAGIKELASVGLLPWSIYLGNCIVPKLSSAFGVKIEFDQSLRYDRKAVDFTRLDKGRHEYVGTVYDIIDPKILDRNISLALYVRLFDQAVYFSVNKMTAKQNSQSVNHFSVNLDSPTFSGFAVYLTIPEKVASRNYWGTTAYLVRNFTKQVYANVIRPAVVD